MTGKDLLKFARYCFNVDAKQFAKDIYQKDNIDEYIREKFSKMQNNTIYWLGTLDDEHLERLAQAANKK